MCMFCAVFPLARFLVSVCIGSQHPWNLGTWAPLRALNALKAGCRSFSVYISAACQPATPAGKAPHHLSKWGRTEVMVKGFWITGDLESESKSEPQIFSNHASPPFWDQISYPIPERSNRAGNDFPWHRVPSDGWKMPPEWILSGSGSWENQAGPPLGRNVGKSIKAFLGTFVNVHIKLYATCRFKTSGECAAYFELYLLLIFSNSSPPLLLQN